MELQAVPTASATIIPTITNTSPPTVTPFPTPTRGPTSTNLPTSTHPPTLPPLPTHTPLPTGIESYAETATSEAYLSLGGPTWTPVPWKCQVGDIYPPFGQVYPPRTDFVAEWKVFNMGSAVWRKDDIVLDYVSGDKLHHLDYEPTFLYYTVYYKDKIPMRVHLKSPKLPGVYITTWGLRRSNKQEPFCSFSIKIYVAK